MSFSFRCIHPSALSLSALFLAVTPLAASADPVRDEAQFDLVMLGLTAGSVTFSGVQDGTSYSVNGKLQTAGVFAFLKQVSYDAKSSGSVTGTTYVPQLYSEKADTGERQSQAVMEYQDGVPQVKSYNPPRKPRKTDVDPATQGGTVDPLTALYATLRDVEPGQECTVSVAMFDGRRASRLTLSNPETDGDRVACKGEYRRVAGFSKKDMDKKTSFPFTLTYAPSGTGKMRVVEIEMDTLYGEARLVRQ